MNQKVTIIETSSALAKSISLMHNIKPKGVDCETLGLQPITDKLRTMQISDDENTLVIDALKIGYDTVGHHLRPILEDKEIVKAFHNAKFDVKFIKHYLKSDVERIFDSYLASVLTQAGIRMAKGFHGLEQVTKRYTGLDLPKDEQRSDWSGELSTAQLQYAARDAQVLLPVREAVIEKLRSMSLFRCANLEFAAVLPTAWLELSGFYLDFDQWKDVSDQNRLRAREVAEEICHKLQPVIKQGSLFGDTEINLDSIQQVKKYFLEYGIPMPDSTKEAFLQPLVNKYPLVGLLLEYRGLSKSSSAFGESWANYINPVTGRVHANFMQIGAEDTGRYSCGDPNLQQIPKENLFRNCFKAEEGKSLISGDYSQIELRILADISNDKGAIADFAAGKDFHTAVADKINRSRSIAKNCNFAIPYGAGKTRVAATGKISLQEAEALMDSYFTAFPSFEKWINKQKRQVLRTRQARTVSGRVTRFIFDENDGQQRSQAQRNAVNMPIQGSSADILKHALRVFYDATRDIQDKIKLVNIVHDEINVEAPDDMIVDVSKRLNDSMVVAGEAFVNEVQIKVDVKTSKVWSKE